MADADWHQRATRTGLDRIPRSWGTRRLRQKLGFRLWAFDFGVPKAQSLKSKALFAERLEQHGREHVHFPQAGSVWDEAWLKPARNQPVEHVAAFRDHMNGHVPGRIRTADERGRLVVSNQNHHEILVGVLHQVSGEGAV